MEKLSFEVTKEQLIDDFKVVVADAEALLKANANQGGEKLAEVRAKAEERSGLRKARWPKRRRHCWSKPKPPPRRPTFMSTKSLESRWAPLRCRPGDRPAHRPPLVASP